VLVAYHESFWIAVAAAAPVIALANTVSIIDLAGIWLASKMRRGRRRTFIMAFYFVFVFCSAANLCGQALILYVALRSLYEGIDIRSAEPVSSFVAAGLLYVLFIVIADVYLRHMLAFIEAQERRHDGIKAEQAEVNPPDLKQANASGLGWPTPPPSS
jgi:MFS family permease